MSQRAVTIKISASDEFSLTFKKYSQAVGEAEKETRKAGTASADFGKTIKGMIAAVSLQEVIRFGVEMNALGDTANQTEARYKALSDELGTLDDTMKGLRGATLGIVDDMELQSSAAKLMTVANVSTREELEALLGIIVKSKSPTEDLAGATAGFVALLGNQSIMRLDNYGLSSANVRQEIERLQAANEGLSRSEAFKQAVIAEAQRNMERYGSAVDAAGTSVARIETRWENFVQDFGQRLNIGVESSFNMLELLLGVHPAQVAEVERRTQEALTGITQDALGITGKLLSGYQDVDATFMSRFVMRGIHAAAADPALLNDAAAFGSQIVDEMFVQGEADIAQALNSGAYADLADSLSTLITLRQEDRAEAQAAADEETRRAEATQRRVEAEAQFLSYYEAGNRALHRQAQIQQELAARRSLPMAGGSSIDMMAAMADQFARGAGHVPSFEDGSSRLGSMQFMAPAAAQELDLIAIGAENTLEKMLALEAAFEGTFSEQELTIAKNWTEELRNNADEANRLAEAFENMSANELFGREGGGILGEFSDEIRKDLENMGATKQMLDDIQRTFDLASGRETASGALFSDRLSDVFAGIAMNISPDQAVGMASSLEAVLRQALLDGIDTNSAEFTAKLESAFATINFDPNQFNVTEFLAEFQPAADATATMNTEGTAFAESTVTAESNMSKTLDHAAGIQSVFDDLTSKVYKVRITPELVNVPNLITMLAPALVQWIQGQGGIVPGTSTRASSSGAMARGYE